MRNGGEDQHSRIEDVRRARSRLRTLNDAEFFAADNFAVREAVHAKYQELAFVTGLLPAELRDRSWVLGVERAV